MSAKKKKATKKTDPDLSTVEDPHRPLPPHPDTIRLDYLEDMLKDGYFTGRCRLRRDPSSRGVLLSEVPAYSGETFESIRRCLDHAFDLNFES